MFVIQSCQSIRCLGVLHPPSLHILLGRLAYPVPTFIVSCGSGSSFEVQAQLSLLLTPQEVRSTGAGLISAAFVAIVPSYISRSVAGSYDNEGVAIFALMFVFFFYIKVCSALRPAPQDWLQQRKLHSAHSECSSACPAEFCMIVDKTFIATNTATKPPSARHHF